MAVVLSIVFAAVLVLPHAGAFDLTVLHINDHHSHLSGKYVDLDGSELGFDHNVKVPYGGFPRLVSALNSLQTAAENSSRGVLKLHGGDAITGTTFFSLFQGEADAKMMLRACFDAFVFGSHEFNHGDQKLADFIDQFHSGEAGICPAGTAVVSANLNPGSSSPLKDKFTKSVKLSVNGEEIGVVGVTIKKKTELSSAADKGTTLSDERTSAQAEINNLVGEGVNKIILLTHIGLDLDKTWMVGLNGVDAIVGGDSHSLLGNADTEKVFPVVGAYAQELTNGEGKKVCVVQAWEYTKAIGNLEITFDSAGDVQSCGGGPKFAYDAAGMVFADESGTALNQTEKDTVTAWLDTLGGQWMAVTEDSGTKTQLGIYEAQLDSLKMQKIVSVPENLCLDRIPGQAKSQVCPPEDSKANGGSVVQLVARAFLEVTKIADVSIQNSGGIRTDIPKGDLTHDQVKQMLPFENLLTTLVLTGAQIKSSLEEALTMAYSEGGSPGAYPYSAGLRFAVDASQSDGSRISCLQVNKRLAGSWSSIVDDEEYTVVTNNFIAAGKDGYITFGTVAAQNTFTEYSQGFIDYAQSVSTLTKPPIQEHSTQAYTHTDGEVYSTWDCQSVDAAFAAGVPVLLLLGTLVTFLAM